MKKALLLILCIPLIANSVWAQKLRMNLYTTYVFDDKVDSYYDPSNFYQGTINGGLMWGVGLEYRIRPSIGAELLYLGQYTTAPLTYYNKGNKLSVFDVNMNYIMLASNHYATFIENKLEGYGALMLGVDIVNIHNPDLDISDSKTKFAWGLKLGLNIWGSKNLGLKLQTGLLSVSQAAGAGVGVGTGGAGVFVSSYSTFFQFNIGGGLVYKFGAAEPASPKTP